MKNGWRTYRTRKPSSPCHAGGRALLLTLETPSSGCLGYKAPGCHGQTEMSGCPVDCVYDRGRAVNASRVQASSTERCNCSDARQKSGLPLGASDVVAPCHQNCDATATVVCRMKDPIVLVANGAGRRLALVAS